MFEVIKKQDCVEVGTKFLDICSLPFRGDQDKIKKCAFGFMLSCYVNK